MSVSEKFTLPEIHKKEQLHVTGEDPQRPNRMMETPRYNYRYMNAQGEKDRDHRHKPANLPFCAHPVNKVKKS